jgi:hypothetical protein
MARKDLVVKKRWRPKWQSKRVYKFSFDWALKGMKSWDILYTRKFDADVTSRTTALGLNGTFKTERVVMIHMKSGETEKGVLITKL